MPMRVNHAKGSGDSGSRDRVSDSGISLPWSVAIAHPDDQINGNWLYGSYIPKGLPRLPLNGHQRAVRDIRRH